MPPASINPVYATGAVVLLALVFPPLNALRNLLLLPAYLSLGIIAIFGYLIFTGDALGHQPAASRQRKRHALRPLVFTTRSAWSAVKEQARDENDASRPIPAAWKSISPSLLARLDGIFESVKASFILPWYSRISPSPAFLDAARVLFQEAIANIGKQSDSVDWSTLIIARFLPIMKDHLHHYRTIEHLSSSPSVSSPRPSLSLPLPAKPHPALLSDVYIANETTTPAVEIHLRGLLQRMLDVALPETEHSEVVRIILRELLLGTVMLPVFDLLSGSDFWNRQIDERGGRYLHERKQVDKFLTALSNLPQATAVTPSTERQTPRSGTLTSRSFITADSTGQQFDAFIKSVSKLKSLGDARRLRADVDRELRAARLAYAADTETDEASKGAEKRIKRAAKHTERLERAKEGIDARITVLSSENGIVAAAGRSLQPAVTLTGHMVNDISLHTVLSDPSSLAYWLEYMDRRNRSRLVQFWLTVEGFKDPLEAISMDSDLAVKPVDQDRTLRSNLTTMEDVAFLHDTYFATDNTVNAAPKHVEEIRSFVMSTSERMSTATVQSVRQAVYACQRAVYEQMEEEDWADFKKSELFRKAATDLARSSIARLPRPTPAEAPSHPAGSSQIVPPRFHPVRQVTSPVVPKRIAETRLQSTRNVPLLVNGNFTPSTTMASASLSLSPPAFERTVTEPKSRPAAADSSPSPTDLPATPSGAFRRSNQLDFLISNANARTSEIPQNRGKLFDEDEAVEVEDDEEYVQIQRMEAIQAALNEIIAADDVVTTASDDRSKTLKDSDEANTMSASMILLGTAQRHDAAVSRLASRSVEDLKAPRLNRSSSSAPQSRVPSHAKQWTRPLVERRRSVSKMSTPDDRNRLFEDDDDDDTRNTESGTLDSTDDNVVELAAPGDLQLSVEIARLQDKIQDLVKQDHLLDTLIRQAELTGNEPELRILSRSQSSVRREQRTTIFQKAQFEQQEEENQLSPERTRVTIPSAVVTGEEGKQVVRYTVEVAQVAEDGSVRSAWVVARRYNEFYELDRAVRDLHAGAGPEVEDVKRRLLELPGKRLVPSLSSAFIEGRRMGLERYMQALITSSRLCDTPVIRNFLSRSHVSLNHGETFAPISALAPHNIVKSLYKTMATSLDDALLGPSMLDLMYTTLSRQLNDVAEGFGGIVGFKPEEIASFGNALLPGGLKGGALTPSWLRPDPMATGVHSGNRANQGIETSPAGRGEPNRQPVSPVPPITPIGGESGSTAFTAPICDFFIEVFDLKENNWLRRQAIVVILQQFLGSTIERKVRDTVRNALSQDSLDRALAGLQETMWPNGVRRPASAPRSELEMAETRLRAGRKLELLIPDVAANMIGKGNARRAARRVFGMLQDRRLNQQLVLCLLDELFVALFPAKPPVP